MKTRKPYVKLVDKIPEVVRMRSEGMTLEQIGEHYGLSRQRINQIEQAAEIHEEILRQWGFPFSTRTANTMERLAITTRQEALDLYNSGHLRPGAVRGFGWVSYHEICEWLEVPTTREPINFLVCPHCGKKI
jgi:transcriptional regulator with XRE-family HTH domain